VAVLSVEGLRKRYGSNEVVRGLDFSIERGECFGLLGPNGAGKTTTLRLCLGLTEPDAGRITLTGRDVPAQAREARAAVGIVPQFDNLDPDFTVEENLLIYARYFGLREREVRPRLPELLAFAGLEGRERSTIQSLSGGMKRRLTLARALVNDPEILFLDEPTTGLDPQARHIIWERLRQLAARGKTLVLTTHFMDEAERLCTRIAVMDQGRIIASGKPRDLIQAHIEPHVVEIFGDDAADWAEREARPLARRVECVGETAFCYLDRADALIERLEQVPHLRYIHRHGTLEDLFVKLTGRELRD
jgi:lipooligosaccharide transport system ATP-binding protein